VSYFVELDTVCTLHNCGYTPLTCLLQSQRSTWLFVAEYPDVSSWSSSESSLSWRLLVLGPTPTPHHPPGLSSSLFIAMNSGIHRLRYFKAAFRGEKHRIGHEAGSGHGRLQSGWDRAGASGHGPLYQHRATVPHHRNDITILIPGTVVLNTRFNSPIAVARTMPFINACIKAARYSELFFVWTTIKTQWQW